MDFFISIREGISRVYGEHDTLIRMLLKFVAAIITFVMINQVPGQMAILNNPLIILVLAGICAFLPSNSTLLIAVGISLAHLYGVSLEAALSGGGMLIVVMLIYYSMAPKTAFPLLFGAITAGVGVPGVAAILVGLVGGPLSAFGVGCGILLSRILITASRIGENLNAVSTDAADALMEKMLELILVVISDREMILSAVLCALIIWIVGMIRRLPIKSAWMIATAVGLFFYEAGIFAGEAFWGITINYFRLGMEAVIALLLAWFAQLILFNLNYKRTESVQFEDDEYVYYVKAVPKRKKTRRKTKIPDKKSEDNIRR